MAWYFVLFVSLFFIALCLFVYRKIFFELAQNSVALVNTLITDYEDDVKIERVQKFTNNLVFSLLKMLLTFVGAFIVGSIPVLVYLYFSKSDFKGLDFSSFSAILSISAGATLPFVLPIHKKKNSSYSELSELLHRLALDNYTIANKLFKLETKKIKKNNLKRSNKFLIVTGLARAGTTSLMNDLSKMDELVSLNYANMPFLMCPNFWSKIYKPKSNKKTERSHKDGIMIGLNSNEALEEFFFKVKAEDAYIHENSLVEYEISETDYQDYLDYQTIIKMDDKKTYLAKNNNFILRYKKMRELNNDFIMVILYRDPLKHAASLLEKHRSYSEIQENDPFVLEYMNWLGHHEFGKNQKPFEFTNDKRHESMDKFALDYWLVSWINYYNHVLTIRHKNTLLVNYDTYCENPKNVIQHILHRAGIDEVVPSYQKFENRRVIDVKASSELIESAQIIYQKLVDVTETIHT